MGNRKNLPQYATQSPALGLTLVKKDFTEKSLRGQTGMCTKKEPYFGLTRNLI
jgi:hypothetical protein